MKPTSRILTLLALFALAFPLALAQTKNQQSTTTATTTPTTTIAATTPQSSGSTATTSTASNQAASKNAFQFSSDSIVLQSDPEPQLLLATCGHIIDRYENRELIENCTNIFQKTKDTFPGQLTVDGTLISDNSSIKVPEGGTTNFSIQLDESLIEECFYGYTVYKKVGDDWVAQFSENDLYQWDPTSKDFRAYLTQKGLDQSLIEKYVAVYTGSGSYWDLEEWQRKHYRDTEWNFRNDFEPIRLYEIALTEGFYTLVVPEGPCFSLSYKKASPVQDFFRHIKEAFIPTAYAAPSDNQIYTLTFEITEGEQEPKISNVLFFPGIQASRLYTKDDLGLFDIAGEEKVWEPSGNSDVRALTMSIKGESLYNIYTNDVIDSIKPVGGTIYKNFLESIKTFTPSDVMDEFSSFAYDWRYDVFDVVENGTQYKDKRRYPTQQVEELAKGSKTGKVTLIGHSNGGLLIKALMLQLEKEGKTNLVDKIIFIGTPHLGTPKAIGTVLHGYDQEKLYGLVVDDVIAREVIRNLPGVYNLLPSETYVNQTNEPIISFKHTSSTQSFMDAYGSDIDSFVELQQFLINAEGNSERNAATYHDKKSDINIPSEANWNLLPNAEQQHASLDSWKSTVDVYNLVGTGSVTPKSIEYLGMQERVCPKVVYGACEYVELLKPRVHFTLQGDATVTSLSAKYMPDAKTYYLNLGFTENVRHDNLTELETVQNAVNTILQGKQVETNQNIGFAETYLDQELSIEIIDSPVSITVTDKEGNKTGIFDGQILEGIPGSTYLEFGGAKYVITPKEVDTTTTLVGTGTGSYTLTLATLKNDEQIVDTVLSDIPVTPQLKATYSKRDGTYSFISSDNDGDDVVDTRIDVDGTITTLTKPKNPTKAQNNNMATRTRTSSTGPKPRVLGINASVFSLDQVRQLLMLLQTTSVSPELKVKIEARVRVLLQNYIQEIYDTSI